MLLLRSGKIDSTVLTGMCAMFRAAPRLLDGSLSNRQPIQTLFVLADLPNDALLVLLA